MSPAGATSHRGWTLEHHPSLLSLLCPSVSSTSGTPSVCASFGTRPPIPLEIRAQRPLTSHRTSLYSGLPPLVWAPLGLSPWDSQSCCPHMQTWSWGSAAEKLHRSPGLQDQAEVLCLPRQVPRLGAHLPHQLLPLAPTSHPNTLRSPSPHVLLPPLPSPTLLLPPRRSM